MAHFSVGKQAAGLAGWFAVVMVVAGLGALASVSAGSFYEALTRPDWAPMAGLLMVPYLLWVSFAVALNISVWRLNPGML